MNWLQKNKFALLLSFIVVSDELFIPRIAANLDFVDGYTLRFMMGVGLRK